MQCPAFDNGGVGIKPLDYWPEYVPCRFLNVTISSHRQALSMIGSALFGEVPAQEYRA
jgi:hypothetical protein